MKTTLFVIFQILTYYLFSQEVKINCIIFIDGKLPESSIGDLYFGIKQSNGEETKIGFGYHIGDILLNDEDNEQLNKLKSTDSITMNISYISTKGISYNYSAPLLVDWLRMRYLIVRITNLDLETGKYYFAFSTPDIDYKFLFEEYMIFEE
jgi:hypothetical protein